MKNIAILTDFRDFDSSYSLCLVVKEQVKFLIDHGYKPRVLVTEGFKPVDIFTDPAVDLRFLPDQIRQNTAVIDDEFNSDVEKLEASMLKELEGIDIVLTHDTIYQPASFKHNVAIRAVADKTNLKFMHWIHSATSPYTMAELVGHFKDEYKISTQKPFPRSYYIFFNNWSISRIAKAYNVPESQVKIVHHPTDYAEFAKFHPISKKIVEDYNLYDKEYICVYPARLDTGKQLEYPIKLMGALKDMKYSVMFIAVDFHSSSDDPKDPKFVYRQQLKDVAVDWGLNETDILFTSEISAETKVSVPSAVVADMFDISNIFFMSSASESYSLVTQEAGMKGNLLIVNRNFPPFRDIFGAETLRFPCLSGVNVLDMTEGETSTTFPDGEKEAYLNLAKEVIAHTQTYQEHTRRKLLKERNPHAIFTRQLEPLFTQICDEYDKAPL